MCPAGPVRSVLETATAHCVGRRYPILWTYELVGSILAVERVVKIYLPSYSV